MRLSHKQIHLAATAALALCGAAQAGTLVQSSSTEALAPATVMCGSQTSCSAPSSATGSFSFNQFSADTGVLIGATFSVTMSGSPTVDYRSIRNGSATYQETTQIGGLTITSSASDVNGGTASANANAYTTTASPLTDLSGLVGSGTVSGTVTGTLSATKTVNGNSATASVSSHQTIGTISYSYLSHANASFAGSDTDSANLTAGSSFSVYNLLGADGTAANLALKSITCSGDCSAFDLGFSLNSFSALVGGGSALYTTAMSATAAGSYAARYTLEFIDSASGAAASTLRTSSLALDLTGQVAAVPEPETAALFLTGLLALGAVRRRRNGQA